MTELIDVVQGFKTVLEMNNVVPSSIIQSRHMQTTGQNQSLFKYSVIHSFKQ